MVCMVHTHVCIETILFLCFLICQVQLSEIHPSTLSKTQIVTLCVIYFSMDNGSRVILDQRILWGMYWYEI